jgi:hypothetical protein
MSKFSLIMMSVLALALAAGSCTSKRGLQFAEVTAPSSAAPVSHGGSK